MPPSVVTNPLNGGARDIGFADFALDQINPLRALIYY